MRVPPSQSCARTLARASASSGSRRVSSRVMLVSRVAKTKLCTRRCSLMACRKCRNRREYSAIEPEMSQSATIGGGRSRGARKARSIAPPARTVRWKLRRGSMRPRGRASNRRVRVASSGSRRFAIRRRACATSSALIWAKSLAFSTSACDTDRVTVVRSSSVSLGLGFSVFGDSASCTRNAPAFGGLGGALSGATGDIWAIIFSMRSRRRQNSRKASANRVECSRRRTSTACSVQ